MADTRYQWAPYAGVFGPGASTTHDNDQVLLVPIAGETEGPQVWAVMVGRRRAGTVDAPGVEQAILLAELVLDEWGAAQQKSPAASLPG